MESYNKSFNINRRWWCALYCYFSFCQLSKQISATRRKRLKWMARFGFHKIARESCSFDKQTLAGWGSNKQQTMVRNNNSPVCRINCTASTVRIHGSLEFSCGFKSGSGGCRIEVACSCDEKQGENEGMFGKDHYVCRLLLDAVFLQIKFC